MSSSTATRLLTFDEFERMSDYPGKQELLRGELSELPPPKLKHNRIAHRIYERLKSIVAEAHTRGDVAKLGEVWHEMGYRFEDDSWLLPDVSITHAGQKSNDYLLGSPALAVEVISEGPSADYIDSKIKHYLDHGALQVWVVYPNRRYLWIYETGGKGEMRSGSFISDLLGGATIDLNQLFGPEN